MHEPITRFPKGRVIGALRLAKGQQFIDVTRIRYGTQNFFVERVTYQTPTGPQQTAFRRTDAFPHDRIANRFITDWLSGKVKNQGYRVLHRDPDFDKYDALGGNDGQGDAARA
jgi:hypothetical protein